MYTRHPLQHFINQRHLYELSLKTNSNNFNEIPKLTKITLNLNSTEFKSQHLIDFLGVLQLITKQKATFCRSKKTVISLKIRKNQIMGFQVILREKNMLNFLLRFCALIGPRYPFFQKFVGGYHNGDISFSYDKLSFFHELDLDPLYMKSNFFPKLNITFHTTANSKKNALILLSNLQVPIELSRK